MGVSLRMALTIPSTLTFTIPTLTSLTQTQLIYLTAGGLSLAAAGGLGALAVASSLLADGGGGGQTGYGVSSYGYSAPSSGYGEPSSGYEEPSSGYSAPASGYNAPSSGYSTPSSGYSAPSSGYSAPSSGYSAPSSGYSAPSSGYSAPSSGYSSPSGGQVHSRKFKDGGEKSQDKEVQRFQYQWQENIAKLRGKRDVTDKLNDFIESMNDKSNCGKMYLCELSATEEHLLNRDERETVKLFKKSYKKEVKTTSVRGGYDFAWLLGSKYGDIKICKKEFSKCQIPSVVEVIRNHMQSAKQVLVL